MFRLLDMTAKGSRRRRAGAALLGLLVALGAAAAVDAATSPDFTLTAQPPSETIASGASTSYVMSIVPVNGFSSAVTLTAGTLPKGTSASWTIGATTTSGSTVTAPAGAGSIPRRPCMCASGYAYAGAR